jgi:hypothetical protein
MSLSHCLGNTKLLAHCSTPRPEDHPYSAVRDCLFNVIAATLHSGGRSSILILRTLHAMVKGTHLPWVKLQHCINQEFNIKTPNMFQPEDSFPNTHNHKRKKSWLTYNHLIIETY